MFSPHCVYALSVSTERCEVRSLTNSVINKSLLNVAIEITLSVFKTLLQLEENYEALS